MAKTMKIRVDDTVQIRTGKDAGKRGRVVRVNPETQRVVVEGVNVVKRHTKPRPSTNPQDAARSQSTGGVIEQEAAVHVSNVAVLCPERDRPARIGFRTKDDGRKVRVARIAGHDVDLDK